LAALFFDYLLKEGIRRSNSRVLEELHPKILGTSFIAAYLPNIEEKQGWL